MQFIQYEILLVFINRIQGFSRERGFVIINLPLVDRFHYCNSSKQNIIKTDQMRQFSTLLRTIRAMSTSLRSRLIEYGLSVEQANQYLIHLLQEDGHTQQYVASIGEMNSDQSVNKLERRLIEIIKKLEEELSCPDSEDESATEIEKQILIASSESSNRKKLSFHIEKDQSSSEKQEKQEKQQIITPKRSIKLKEYFDEMDVSKNFDVIEQSIKETLQRTRKLRTYLDIKTKMSQSKSRYSNSREELQSIF